MKEEGKEEGEGEGEKVGGRWRAWEGVGFWFSFWERGLGGLGGLGFWEGGGRDMGEG